MHSSRPIDRNQRVRARAAQAALEAAQARERSTTVAMLSALCEPGALRWDFVDEPEVAFARADASAARQKRVDEARRSVDRRRAALQARPAPRPSTHPRTVARAPRRARVARVTRTSAGPTAADDPAPRRSFTAPRRAALGRGLS